MPAPELVELLTPEADAGIKQLMCLDDAIAHRLHLLAQPCPDCQPAGQCPEHASYHGVIAAATPLRHPDGRPGPGGTC
jgi:hypothetical protein